MKKVFQQPSQRSLDPGRCGSWPGSEALVFEIERGANNLDEPPSPVQGIRYRRYTQALAVSTRDLTPPEDAQKPYPLSNPFHTAAIHCTADLLGLLNGP